MKKIFFGLIGIGAVLLADFTRDNTKEVVLDSQTYLMWQDGDDVKTKYFEWEGAIEYCNNLDFSGYTDWRLPNVNELITILDFSQNNIDQRKKKYINKSFENITPYEAQYWSSTNSNWPQSSDTRWLISFSAGTIKGDLHKDSDLYVRCVRDK